MGIDPLRASSSSRWELLEDARPVRRRILCSASPGRSCPVRLHGFLESRGVAVCDSGFVLRLGAVFSGRCAGRVAGATPLERSCRSLAERFTDHARGGDSACCTVQPRRRIARPTYGGYRRSRSVSAPGRNPAVAPVLALFTVGDVYASLCKRGVYSPFSAPRRSRALF